MTKPVATKKPKPTNGKRVVKGAGGVVVNPNGELLLVRYPTGSWAFAKGHVEEGESLEQAAVREVFEEGGVKAKIIAPLGTTDYMNTKGIRRLVYWYAMRTKSTTCKPEPGFGAALMTPKEAFANLAHEQNRELLARALPVLGLGNGPHGAPSGTLYALGQDQPNVAESAFVAPGANVIGRVQIGAGSSVWFGAVLRGDTESIVVGAGSNIQDGAVLHADPGFPCVVGDNVTVGHRAVVHGATLEDGCVVGMGATVLNGARIGAGAVVAAGAVVTQNQSVPNATLVAGVPARAIGDKPASNNATHYTELALRYRQELRAIEKDDLG